MARLKRQDSRLNGWDDVGTRIEKRQENSGWIVRGCVLPCIWHAGCDD